MRIDRLTGAVAAAALLTTSIGAPARADKWTNHIDASMINEIVVRDQTLYIATFGGLLLYDIDDGTFVQYRNDSGLPSNAIQCLVFNADGDIYAGTADVGMAKVRIANGKLTLKRSLSEQIDGLASSTINSVAVWGEDIVYGSTPGGGHHSQRFRFGAILRA
jgi:outer membrane protein assembly factor BamB